MIDDPRKDQGKKLGAKHKGGVAPACHRHRHHVVMDAEAYCAAEGIEKVLVLFQEASLFEYLLDCFIILKF